MILWRVSGIDTASPHNRVRSPSGHGEQLSISTYPSCRWLCAKTFITGHHVAPVKNRVYSPAAMAPARRAGLSGVHPHALRHSAAAVLLSAGMPLAAVADQLGHGSSAVTALVYEHVLDSTRVQNAAVLDRYYDMNYDASTRNPS